MLLLLQVPAKWDNILRKSEVYQEIAGDTKTPPKTPPRGSTSFYSSQNYKL